MTGPGSTPRHAPDMPADGIMPHEKAVGVLVGIARHGKLKGPMEAIERVGITVAGGLDGDARGTVRPGGTGKRQVTLMEQGDWNAALAELGAPIPWQERRVNMLVDRLDLPQVAGTRLRIGNDVLLEVTIECNPCRRMDDVAQGLRAALTPDWRGGVCTRVLAGGNIAIDDVIRIEIP